MLQATLILFALGNIPRHSQLYGLAMVLHGDRVCFKPATPALETLHFKLQLDGFTGEYPCMQVGESLAMRRRNHIDDRFSNHLGQRISLDHGQPCRIHLLQKPLRVNDLDAFGFVQDDGT